MPEFVILEVSRLQLALKKHTEIVGEDKTKLREIIAKKYKVKVSKQIK